LLPSLRTLMRVQELDAEIFGLDEGITACPVERSEIAAGIAQAKRAIDAAKKVISETELKERSLESDMQAQEALMARLDEQTYQVKSQQAYDAIRLEMQNAREAGSGFETQALELMEALDTARMQLEEAESHLAALEEEAPIRLKSVDDREAGQNSERERLLEARGKECADIETKVLALYERIRVRCRPTVLVLEERSCPMCRIAVPRQNVSAIERGEEITTCSSCQRLLVSRLVLEDG